MKKIIITLTFMFLTLPVAISALGANGTVGGVGRTFTYGNGGCTGMITLSGIFSYKCGDNYRLETEGLRITFYNLNGKQLGNTIDVWTKRGLKNSKSLSCTSTGRFFKCSEDNVKFISGTPSRFDYYKKVVDNLGFVEAKYVYYVDSNYENQMGYNPLWYTRPNCSNNWNYTNEAFKSYFTSPAIVKEYIKIAGITDIDPYETSEYIFILEPIFSVGTCGTSADIYSALFTNADYHYFIKRPKVASGKDNNFVLNCDASQYIVLEKDAEIKLEIDGVVKAVTFKKPSGFNSDCWPNWEDLTTNPVGYGMYLVYGNQVCKNCSSSSSRGAIVYHTINLSQPFLTIDGKTRTLDATSNWYQKEATIDENIYKQKPKYTVVLTPTVIKQIRAENKNIDYSKLSAATFEKFKNTYASIFK